MSELAQEQSARHQVFVQRFGAYLANQYTPYQDRIKQAVDAFILNLDGVSSARLESELERLSQQQGEIYQEYIDYVLGELEEFSKSEAEFQIEQVEDIEESPQPEQVIQNAILGAWTAATLTNLVFPQSNTTILLIDYLEGGKQAQAKRIKDAIRTGVLTSQSIQQIKASVNDVLSKRDKSNVRTSVVTGTNHVSATARTETLKKSGVIGYEWVSVLDSRTSAICRSLDNQVFLFGKREYYPLPPQHPNCRSAISPIFKDAKKTKRARRKTETGTVGANSTYYGWLKNQSAAFQDDVIGSTRGKLLRNGGLTSKEFAALNVDKLFRPLTLEEMRKRNPLAFDKANID